MDGQTDGRTDGRMDRQTDERKDGELKNVDDGADRFE